MEKSKVITWAKSCYGFAEEHTPNPVVVLAEQSRSRLNCSIVDHLPESPGEGRAATSVSAVCLSSRESFTRWIEAPFASISKARKVLPTLLDIQLPFPLDDCVYCFLDVAGTRRNTVEALAVGARLADVERKLESLAANGIDPVVIDQEGLALWTQSLSEIPMPKGEEDALRVVMHLGTAHWTVVVGRNGRFENAHAVKTEDIAQIKRILHQHLPPESDERDDKVHWIWTGPGAIAEETISAISACLLKRRTETSFIPEDPRAFLARAAATRALVSGPLRCNLRHGRLTHPSITRRRARQLTKAAAIFLASGALLCGAGALSREIARKKEAKITRAFQSLSEALTNRGITAGETAAFPVIASQARQRIELLQPFMSPFSPSLTLTLARIMETGRKSGLKYDTLAISRDDLLLKGRAAEWNDCDMLVEGLKNLGRPVKLERTESLTDESILFTIKRGGNK